MLERRVRKIPVSFYQYFGTYQPKYKRIEIQISDKIIDQTSKKAISRLRKGDKSGNAKFKKDEWNEYGIKDIIRQVKEWKIQKGLYLEESCRQPYILSQIAGIRFEFLTSLNLNGNNIGTIQAICNLNMPHLERINLSQNKITNIQSLRRSYFPNLISCSLGGNRIADFSPLFQFHTPLLKHFYQEYRADGAWSSLFTWIAKLQTSQLDRLWVASNNRIWQRSAQQCLQRRYRKKRQITFYVGNVNL